MAGRGRTGTRARVPARIIRLACAHSEALAEVENWNWRLARAQENAGGTLDIRFDARFRLLCRAEDASRKAEEELRSAERGEPARPARGRRRGGHAGGIARAGALRVRQAP